MTLINLAAATFDLARAGLGGGVAASLQVNTDTDAAIVLTGLEPGQAVTLGGATVTAGADGSARFTVPAGIFTLDIGGA